MNKQQKVDLLKGIYSGEIKLDAISHPYKPTFAEIIRFKEIKKAGDDASITEEDRAFCKKLEGISGRITLDHLSFPELYYLKYGFFPDETD